MHVYWGVELKGGTRSKKSPRCAIWLANLWMVLNIYPKNTSNLSENEQIFLKNLVAIVMYYE